jgi:hypothetical protein
MICPCNGIYTILIIFYLGFHVYKQGWKSLAPTILDVVDKLVEEKHVRCGLICFKKCFHTFFENELIITFVNIFKM